MQDVPQSCAGEIGISLCDGGETSRRKYQYRPYGRSKSNKIVWRLTQDAKTRSESRRTASENPRAKMALVDQILYIFGDDVSDE
jgi:hypothetical protein